MFAVGVMNLIGMALITLLILLEKIAPVKIGLSPELAAQYSWDGDCGCY
jgi:predicted metal-binding membrane protein